ncbi:MAG: putative quinol monooxygenase [Conexibacter sp.]
MIGVVVTYTVEDSKADEVAELFERYAARVAETEPECIHWLAIRSGENPSVFHLWEVYTDDEALRVHRETPHFEEMIANGVRRHVLSRVADTGEAIV